MEVAQRLRFAQPRTIGGRAQRRSASARQGSLDGWFDPPDHRGLFFSAALTPDPQPVELFGRPSDVAVSATHVTFRNLSEEPLNWQALLDEDSNVLVLGASDMIELKDERVRFATVDTRVRRQVLQHNITIALDPGLAIGLDHRVVAHVVVPVVLLATITAAVAGVVGTTTLRARSHLRSVVRFHCGVVNVQARSRLLDSRCFVVVLRRATRTRT